MTDQQGSALRDTQPLAARCPHDGPGVAPICLKPLNCGRFGCLSQLNRERAEAHQRAAPQMPLTTRATTTQSAYVEFLESQVAWIQHLISFMDVKLVDDPDYEVLRSLLHTLQLGRTATGRASRPDGQVFAIVHGNRWNERIDPALALQAAWDGALSTMGPVTGDRPDGVVPYPPAEEERARRAAGEHHPPRRNSNRSD